MAVVSADSPPAALDPFARHLSQLLSIADLSGRLSSTGDEAALGRDAVALVRRATGASRASLFQIDNADAESDEPLWVVRVARDAAAADGVDPEAPFHPRSAALLLSVLQTGGVLAMGPLSPAEPFYAQHQSQEPGPTRHAAFAPVVVGGEPAGVLEIARGAEESEPFAPAELAALEAGARTVAAAVYGTRRERSMQAMLTALLPELLDPARAPTSLPARVREWLASRRMAPEEREAIAIAAAVAELSQASAPARGLVLSVLAAARKAFIHDLPGWSEAPPGPR